MSDAAPTNDSRVLAIILGLVAAGLLVYAAFTPHWLASAAGDLQVGLRNGADVWQARGWDYAASPAFGPCGIATLVTSLLAAFGLVVASALAALRIRRDLPMSPSTLALLGIMTSLITGCVFAATKPGGAGVLGVGMSFWIFGAGAVIGIYATTALAKINRPVDPDLLDDSMNPNEF